MSKTVLIAALVCLLFAAGGHCGDSSTRSLRLGRQLKEERKCEPTVGTDWFGGDIYQYPIEYLGSAAKCCERCLEEPDDRCKAYIYRLDHDHCWLKNVVNAPSNCDQCSGQIFKDDDLLECNPTFGKDHFGGDIYQSPKIVNSYQECCAACKADPACSAYTYRTDYRHCWLKNYVFSESDCPTCVTEVF